MMSNQTITTDLLVELSTEEQELLAGGYHRHGGWHGGHGRHHRRHGRHGGWSGGHHGRWW